MDLDAQDMKEFLEMPELKQKGYVRLMELVEGMDSIKTEKDVDVLAETCIELVNVMYYMADRPERVAYVGDVIRPVFMWREEQEGD